MVARFCPLVLLQEYSLTLVEVQEESVGERKVAQDDGKGRAAALQRFSADRRGGGSGGWRGGVGGGGGGGVGGGVGGVCGGGDEEGGGGLEEMEPEGADEVAVVAAADVLRAQGEAQREIETGGEIQHEGASDPEGGHEQRT